MKAPGSTSSASIVLCSIERRTRSIPRADRARSQTLCTASFSASSSAAVSVDRCETWRGGVWSGQRYVDRVRSTRRFEPLPEEAPTPPARSEEQPQSRISEYIQLMRRAVTGAVSRLPAKDRLRLAYYYAEDLTLAQIGRALGEHEATVSRNLAKARREIRTDVERHLREQEHMNPSQIDECFEAVVEDVGSLDVSDLLGAGSDQPDSSGSPGGRRKDSRDKRSKERPEGASA